MSEDKYLWQFYANDDRTTKAAPADVVRKDLIEGLDFEPKMALDIACGTGGTLNYLKSKYPKVLTVGVETNLAAIKIAESRLNKVITKDFENTNLEAEGVSKGSIDLILCVDALECFSNPWKVIEGLKDYLSPEGRLLLCVSNIRYLPLIDDLSRGYWRYREWGILNIRNLHAFTLHEIKRLLHETGYRHEKVHFFIDSALAAMHDQFLKKAPCDVDTGKIVLRNVGKEELQELFSGQFVVTAKKGTVALENYEAPRMNCSFWQGSQNDYIQFLQWHTLTKPEAQSFDKYIADKKITPFFSVIIVCASEKIDQLPASIRSVGAQLYNNFNLVIIGEGKAPEALQFQAKIKWVDGARQPWSKINEQLLSSPDDWVFIMDAGDQLLPHALLYMTEFAERHPDVSVIYFDEDRLDHTGLPEAPCFKPDFCPDYFLSQNYVGDGVAFKILPLLDNGGFRMQFGSPLYDALLQIYAQGNQQAFGHIPDVLYHRHPQRSLQRSINAEDYGQAALKDYLNSTGKIAEIATGFYPGSRCLRYSLTEKPPVLWIAKAPDNLSDAAHLIENEFATRSYREMALAVLVDAAMPADVLLYWQAVEEAGVPGLHIFMIDASQTLVQQMDTLVRDVGDDFAYILFRDATCRSTDINWLEDLMADAIRPEIAAVAPRLLDSKGHLVGNALILGCEGFVTGFGAKAHYSAPGYFGRQLIVQNPTALSADCLIIRRKDYLTAGGMQADYTLSAAIIDLCLRLKQEGLRLLWTPQVSLVFSDAKPYPDRVPMLQQESLNKEWLPQIARDPFYNLCFSRHTPFLLGEKPQVSKLRLPWKPLPRVLAFPADETGCGTYRIMQPFHAVQDAGLIEGHMGFLHFDPFEMEIFEADSLVLQRQVSDIGVKYLEKYRRHFNFKLIYELDDLITDLPEKSLHKPHMPKDIDKRLKDGLELCDRFVVSTEPLKAAYQKYISDIVVVPNRIDKNVWGNLSPLRRQSKKPRVGWTGGISHSGDLAILIDVLKETAGEVEWYFLGMCLDEFAPYLKEHFPGVPTPRYPAKLASLHLDLAVAPLEHNTFNESKSNLKLLEYGILGYPVIASDFGPYQCKFPVTLVKNTTKAWVKAIREHTNDLDECAKRGDVLRDFIQKNWILQDHLDEWRAAWLDF